jgi:acetyl-CoA C-acetyltransferase
MRLLNKHNRVGVFVGNFDAEQYANQGHLGAFLTEVDTSFIGVPSARYEAACASGSVAIDAAATKIRAGELDVAIVLGIEVMKTVSAKTGADFLGTAAFYELEAKGQEFPFPRLFGQLADLLIQRYQLDEKRFLSNLAEIAAINFDNAKRNPKAQTRSWFMSREHANRRNTQFNISVGGQLCATDCSQITDGAALVVLTSDKYAEEYSGKHGIPLATIPLLKGWGHRVAPLQFANKIDESLTSKHLLPWTRQAILDAYERAGLTIDDIDVIETHDCFTSSEYAAISAFGLTEPGQEHLAIESGLIAFGGKKPINPSGGLIGVGHPVGASGVRMMLDLYKQMVNHAECYQVSGACNGAMLNIGGSATTNYVYIVGLA